MAKPRTPPGFPHGTGGGAMGRCRKTLPAAVFNFTTEYSTKSAKEKREKNG
jgi:hypothetical protein